MKWYCMEWLHNGRCTERFQADNKKEANKIAAYKAKARGITEYYVYAQN